MVRKEWRCPRLLFFAPTQGWEWRKAWKSKERSREAEKSSWWVIRILVAKCVWNDDSSFHRDLFLVIVMSVSIANGKKKDENDVLLCEKITKTKIKGKPALPLWLRAISTRRNYVAITCLMESASMEECVSSLMEGRSWRSTHLLFVVHEMVLAFRRFNRHQVLMNCISSACISPTPCCIEQNY